MALILVLALVVSIGGGLLLYVMVRDEHADRKAVDRRSGERIARQDTPDGPETARRSSHDSSSDRSDRRF